MVLKNIVLELGLNSVVYAENRDKEIKDNVPLYLKIGTLNEIREKGREKKGVAGKNIYSVSGIPLGDVDSLKNSLQIDDGIEETQSIGGKQKSKKGGKQKSRRNQTRKR